MISKCNNNNNQWLLAILCLGRTINRGLTIIIIDRIVVVMVVGDRRATGIIGCNDNGVQIRQSSLALVLARYYHMYPTYY